MRPLPIREGLSCGDDEDGKLFTSSVDHKFLAAADGDLSQEWKKVVRDALGVLAHDAGRVGTGGVEVSKQCAVPAGVRLDMILDHHFDHHLGPPIRVGRADRAVLGNRDHVFVLCGISVDSRRRRKDNIFNIILLHCAEEGDSAADVDAVVFDRLFGGFSHGLDEYACQLWVDQSKTKKSQFSDLQSSKVDHGVNLRMLLENPIQALLIGDIDVVEFGLLPADELDTVEDLLARVVQVIHDDNIVPSAQKFQRGEGTDISSSSG